MSALARAAAVAASLLCAAPPAVGPARAQFDVAVAAGWRTEVVAAGVPRPVDLHLDAAWRLVILSHGWRGDAAAEILRLDPRGEAIDAARLPRLVLPFSEEPRKVAFGSVAIDPRSGDLFLGEENGNRIYRLSAPARLTVFGIGLNHLVGGSALAFDTRGRLVALDYASPDVQLRAELPPPPGLEALAGDAYHGPVVVRVDPEEDLAPPRRLDLVPPAFPRALARRPGAEPLFRLVSVAVTPGGDVVLLSSVGEVLVLAADGGLRRLARLPSGHYHRTHMTVAPTGDVLVSSGFHIRDLYRISPAGAVATIARRLGDPGGLAVDAAGAIYVAEGAHHRIIRLVPPP